MKVLSGSGKNSFQMERISGMSYFWATEFGIGSFKNKRTRKMKELFFLRNVNENYEKKSLKCETFLHGYFLEPLGGIFRVFLRS